jgi:RNA polymerase sigma-70 factor (ECF subfamily)
MAEYAEYLAEAFDGARKGDDEAFSALYRVLQPALLTYLRQRAPEVAEELASESWLAASRALPTVDGGAEGFRAVLFTIARRRVADHYRSRRREPRTVVLGEALEHPAPDAVAALEEAVASRDSVRALTAHLKPDQAEVVLLRVVAGLSVEETARAMGKSPGAIRVLQHRALRALYDVLAQYRLEGR